MIRSALLACMTVALLAAAMMSPAQAQPDRCNDYANQMVAWDSRARQARCVGWTGHSNHRHHYDWCQARPPGAAQTALTTWASRFQNCEFQASGSAAARADGQRCVNYGNEMVRMDQSARQQRCQGWTSHSNRAHHTEWCMANQDRVDGALHHWRNRLRAC